MRSGAVILIGSGSCYLLQWVSCSSSLSRFPFWQSYPRRSAAMLSSASCGSLPVLSYRTVIWTTVRISLEATAITLAVSFPLAWILSRATGIKALLLGLLVLVPFLTSVLVRTFAWLAILGQRGLINATLVNLGLISEPLPLLFSEPAVVMALVHSSIPMMVFALFTILRRIDGRVLIAAHTLGANPVRAWFTSLCRWRSAASSPVSLYLPFHRGKLHRASIPWQSAPADVGAVNSIGNRNWCRLGTCRRARPHARRHGHPRRYGFVGCGGLFFALAASAPSHHLTCRKHVGRMTGTPAPAPRRAAAAALSRSLLAVRCPGR